MTFLMAQSDSLDTILTETTGCAFSLKFLRFLSLTKHTPYVLMYIYEKISGLPKPTFCISPG